MKSKIKELGISDTEINELMKVSKDINKDYELLLKKYPIQYLIGYVNFYGYKINVNKNVLIPRTINYSKQLFKNKKINILDLGTGSGAIAIALNRELNSNITAVDISKKALNIAKTNARENNCNIDFLYSDMFKNINDKYDIIISNPPYISYDEEIMESVKKYEPHKALFANNNGLYFYKKILKKAKDHLNKKFIIAFEIGWNQGNAIKAIAEKYFYTSIITIEKDFSGKDRYIFIRSD